MDIILRYNGLAGHILDLEDKVRNFIADNSIARGKK